MPGGKRKSLAPGKTLQMPARRLSSTMVQDDADRINYDIYQSAKKNKELMIKFYETEDKSNDMVSTFNNNDLNIKK